MWKQFLDFVDEAARILVLILVLFYLIGTAGAALEFWLKLI